MVDFSQQGQNQIFASNSQKMTEIGCLDQINQKHSTTVIRGGGHSDQLPVLQITTFHIMTNKHSRTWFQFI